MVGGGNYLEHVKKSVLLFSLREMARKARIRFYVQSAMSTLWMLLLEDLAKTQFFVTAPVKLGYVYT